jgi:hypothetical protein
MSKNQPDKNRTIEIQHTTSFSLKGYLPVYPHIHGECTIIFPHYTSLAIRLTHENITNGLYDKLQDIREKLRLNVKIPLAVELGNTTICLNWHEINDLYESLSLFLTKYLIAQRNIDRALCTNDFQKSTKNEYAVRLMKIERTLWKEMIEFTKMFDYRSGVTSRHSFEAHEVMIKVPYQWSRAHRKRGSYAMLLPEQTENSFASMKEADHYIWLLWQPFHIIESGMNNAKVWNAKTTYDWLTKEFIPQVVYHRQKQQLKELSYQQFVKEFQVEGYYETEKTIDAK